MEAATLHKKKTAISKGKVKRTIKNILCRPDPVFWPNISEDNAKVLNGLLSKYKVEMPEFKKPHWKELKMLPKDQRPKPPRIKRVEGLIFGIMQCSRTLENKECTAVIIDSAVNPRTLVQNIIETCISTKVPVLCINGMKKMSSLYFGIPTSCLGIKKDCLQELVTKIKAIEKMHKPPEPKQSHTNSNIENDMEVDETTEKKSTLSVDFTYLYRTNKRTRVFNPSADGEIKAPKAFTGQDFIEFSNKPEQPKSDSKAYMNMILKRIGNNQNRVKRK